MQVRSLQSELDGMRRREDSMGYGKGAQRLGGGDHVGCGSDTKAQAASAEADSLRRDNQDLRRQLERSRHMSRDHEEVLTGLVSSTAFLMGALSVSNSPCHNYTNRCKPRGCFQWGGKASANACPHWRRCGFGLDVL